MIVRTLFAFSSAARCFAAALDLFAAASHRVSEVGLMTDVAGELAIRISAIAAVLGPAAADRSVRIGSHRLRDVRVRGVRAEQVARAGSPAAILRSAALVHS